MAEDKLSFVSLVQQFGSKCYNTRHFVVINDIYYFFLNMKFVHYNKDER